MTKRRQAELEAAFARAIAAVKPKAISGSSFYPHAVSGRDVAKSEPALRRAIGRHYSKNLKKFHGDEVKAANATLEELGGAYSQGMGDDALLKRHIVGNVQRHVSRGIHKRYHKKAGSYTSTWKVTSIEAWREPEGGWTWNSSYKAGTVEIPADASNVEILKAMRDAGYLSEKSKGKVRVEHMPYADTMIEIQEKSTGEPLFAIEPKEG
jgi:hypothetical protein